ncbi:hypothetical protein BHM03_00012917 [Ensete ventricosum]|nr:hypothetical protein BHM03_00012917 [Ensete ventricosum]
MGEAPLCTSVGKIDSSSLMDLEESRVTKENKSNTTYFVELLSQMFRGKNAESVPLAETRDLDSLEQSEGTSTKADVCADSADNVPCENKFEELLETMALKCLESDMPGHLPGGILFDQSYAIAPGDLNSLLFSPDSNVFGSFAELQGTTDLQREPWRLLNGESSLKRVMTYTKAATKLIKSVRATEEQTYLNADGKQFAVLASVSIPDVPCGSYFKTEILYLIKPGPQLPSANQSSHLIISWRLNFLQSTMMKGMIESGAKQGLIESFAQFADVLSKHVKPIALDDSSCNIEQNLVLPEIKRESSLGLAFQFLCNFPVLLSLFVGLYVCAHILIANPGTVQGLEFVGLDLPDSFTELLVSAVLTLQGQYVLEVIGRFFRARKHSDDWEDAMEILMSYVINSCIFCTGSDHGVKAQGDGWLLTVALIEGSNIAGAYYSCGFSDPYVVFTCNGKTKTSSIKFQAASPVWNGNSILIQWTSYNCSYFVGFAEIYEFDAMDDPPSRMEVAVYDFDGPLDEAISLGHAEVNFVKSNLSKLADIWIPLQGKFAQACQSKLRLRIFLSNSRGKGVVTDYLTKMEKEVGKKVKKTHTINLRSPQTNSAFQKLFGLPQEEFLINDFSCHLKRKMPLQAQIGLAAVLDPWEPARFRQPVYVE